MNPAINVAIVGATGAVGTEFLQLLEARKFPVGDLKLLASARSAGREIAWGQKSLPVEELTEKSFDGVDLAFFSAGAKVAQQFAHLAASSGARVIDNSSAFRMDPEVPLIIPEINREDLRADRQIVAVPNCTTIVALMALYPLHRAFRLRRVVAASYQAVSGAGAKAIVELSSQTKAFIANEQPQSAVFPHPIAFNVIPQVDVFLENGYTKEEGKFLNESRKILRHPHLRASITCVRVPVYRAHAVAINAEFEKTVSLEEARRALSNFPGLELVDSPEKKQYPMPLLCAGRDNCQVGRLRLDTALDNGLAFWVCGDQLRKGAALNAIQIAEQIVGK
jgi:aspartate-semialdehyde dehydrogenase